MQLLQRPEVSRQVAAPADAVWDVLADGWFYATWVVGASRVRKVDRDWPAPGARLHHSVGPWPAVISDSTSVEEAEAPRRLVLRARGWPLGEARVIITVEPDGANQCTVTMVEDAITGPGRLVPMPLRQLGILPRNQEALRRLALIAEGRHREQVAEDTEAGESADQTGSGRQDTRPRRAKKAPTKRSERT
ncbi:polyketide cyclase/dehydrase/lipid transport protein [Knoellia remsis]|uniref:Polyketide cyclase/dehydrase/lipid transport protein n=1 Tax=Knoellia remsis TaxID=407159 RepID=A0A2T0U673_9MICO|nr:SRPBCC family protein [Knoellia remsis]PRY53423.1 polyketide cyclase/dehydrase/lipid transport protein [Knoellia remsis]